MVSKRASLCWGGVSGGEFLFLRRRFAAPKEYKGYEYAEFGVHTVSHRAMDKDVNRYMDEEISPCLSKLMQHGLRLSNYFTLPMRPRYGATVRDLIDPLKKIGFVGVLDGPGVWDQSDFVIPRIDCMQVETVLDLEGSETA